jgi:hypothetical protein
MPTTNAVRMSHTRLRPAVAAAFAAGAAVGTPPPPGGAGVEARAGLVVNVANVVSPPPDPCEGDNEADEEDGWLGGVYDQDKKVSKNVCRLGKVRVP